jgi:putative transcriptional regulator
MVRLRLREILLDQDRNMSWLTKETRLSYQTIFALTKNQTKRVAFETLDVLCRALNCEPGQLFAREEDEKPVKNKVRKPKPRG